MNPKTIQLRLVIGLFARPCCVAWPLLPCLMVATLNSFYNCICLCFKKLLQQQFFNVTFPKGLYFFYSLYFYPYSFLPPHFLFNTSSTIISLPSPYIFANFLSFLERRASVASYNFLDWGGVLYIKNTSKDSMLTSSYKQKCNICISSCGFPHLESDRRECKEYD